MNTMLATIAPVDELEAVTGSIIDTRGILEPLGRLHQLSDVAGRSNPGEAYERLAPIAQNFGDDPLAAYLAVYSLAEVSVRDVDDLYLRLLAFDDEVLSQHVAWAFSRRHPVPAALHHLEVMVARGGFSRMMAELTLESWLGQIPELVWRLDREIADRLAGLCKSTAVLRARNGDGLRIAQILMQGRVDADLTAAGTGDGGGLITLQVGLTRELSLHDDVDDIYLVTRSVEDESGRFTSRSQPLGDGTLVRLPFGEPGYLTVSELWEHRLELEHRLHQFLVAEGPFDALHLRFADVGTLAAARVAEDLGIPVFFTLAPDPHGVIEAAEASGELTRENFGQVEADEHYVFRYWLVNWLIERSDRLALLPRIGQSDRFRHLFGVDVSTDRFAVIPEGIDFSHSQEARRTLDDLPADQETPSVLADLERAIAAMPPGRTDLPLLLTVGRLHPVKGMERVVAAWASEPSIRSQFNLVIIGGDLESPSPTERSTLAEIARSLDGEGQQGLVMLGGRTHAEVALVMAASVSGTSRGIGPKGIYVCGSVKEEFGLAILEAMAAGLPVVAPENGGPSTYVDHGFTGYLVDTLDTSSIQEGIRWGDRARSSELRVDAARKRIATQYSLSAMADSFVDLYELRRAESTG